METVYPCQSARVWQANPDLAIEPAGSPDGRIDFVRVIRRANNNHAIPVAAAIQLFQQDVDDARPPIIMPLGTAPRVHGIELVDKNNRRCGRKGFAENCMDRFRDITKMTIALRLPIAIAGGKKWKIAVIGNCTRYRRFAASRRSMEHSTAVA